MSIAAMTDRLLNAAQSACNNVAAENWEMARWWYNAAAQWAFLMCDFVAESDYKEKAQACSDAFARSVW